MRSPVRIVMGVTVAESLKFLGQIPKLLHNAGWDVHIVSNPGDETKAWMSSDFILHELAMVRSPSIPHDVHSLILWFRLLKRLDPSIVSLGTPKASLLGMIAARALGVPHRIYVLRGLRLENKRGPVRWFLKLFEFITAKSATHIISVSHSLAAKYVALGLCDAAKIFVVGAGSSHGVDTTRFSPRPSWQLPQLENSLALAPNVPVLGFVGRFSRDKGATALLASRKELVKRGIDHELLVIGPIEDSHQTFKELSSLGRPPKHLGRIANVEDYYSLMTVLLLPTSREGFPNVVLEAGATGVPAISRNVTGAKDSIVHNETGILVSEGSDAAFASAVATLLLDSQKIANLGLAAQSRVLREFEEIDVCLNYATFHERLIDETEATES